MATYSQHIWNQVKNCTDKQFCKALERDGFAFRSRKNNVALYAHSDGRQSTVHMHPGQTYGPSLLKSMLTGVGWSGDADLIRVGLAKGDSSKPSRS